MVAQCIDCVRDGITAERPTPFGGPKSPLCYSHEHQRRKAKKARAHETHVQRTYGISPEQYQALYEAQGGLCAICGPTTGHRGASKHLAVDHDHRCCPGPTSCGECVRGLLCATCNDFIGRVRDDPQAMLRGFSYLHRAEQRLSERNIPPSSDRAATRPPESAPVETPTAGTTRTSMRRGSRRRPRPRY